MTIFNLTVRQLMAGKKWLVLLVLALIPLVLSMLDRSGSAADSSYLVDSFPDIVIASIVPIIALLLAGSAFASDMEEGTAVFVLAKPISRTRILMERFAAVATLAVLLTTASALLSIVAQGDTTKVVPFLIANEVAIVVGAIVYSALFLALSLLTRRGLIIGLLYILMWESTLSGSFPGTRTLSIKEYMLTIAGALDKSGLAEQRTSVTVTTAMLMALLILSLAIALALRKLQNYEVAEQG